MSSVAAFASDSFDFLGRTVGEVARVGVRHNVSLVFEVEVWW